MKAVVTSTQHHKTYALLYAFVPTHVVIQDDFIMLRMRARVRGAIAVWACSNTVSKQDQVDQNRELLMSIVGNAPLSDAKASRWHMRKQAVF